MPQDYEAIRDRLIGAGKSSAEAKTEAAKIANARRKKDGKPSINAAVEAEQK